jgi:hypothetical protein
VSVPAIDVPSEGPLNITDPSSDQIRPAQSEGEEGERPKSPWTPSYTVTTLPGSGSSSRADLKPEQEGTAEVEVLPAEKFEGVETPKIVTPQDEEPVEPAAIAETPSWTQSYAVTSQPASPRLSPRAELKEPEPESRPVESVQEPSVAGPIAKFADVPETIITPAVEDEDAVEPVSEEEPKPVWTQSYSVTSQPGSPRVSPKQVSEEIPEIEEIKPSWTQSYYVTSQPGSPRILPKEDLQEPIVEPVAVVDDPVVTPPVEEAVVNETEEQPKSTWTPSYSVTTLDDQNEQTPLEDAMSVPKTFTEEALPEVSVPVTDTSSEPLAVKDEQPERPKSPWTPSYSVTTLPGSSSAKEPNPASVTDEPSADAEPPAPESAKTTETVEDQLKENGTTSDVFEVHEAVSKLTVRDEFQFDAETLEPDRHGLDLVSLFLFC